MKKSAREMSTGLRNMAQRSVNAEEAFLRYIIKRAALTQDQAEHVLLIYRKYRVIKFDAVNGTFHVKHGSFLEKDVLQRASLTPLRDLERR